MHDLGQDLLEQLPDFLPQDLIGMKVRDALALVDVYPKVVYWGCWTEEELDTIL